jgi:formylglycine-generating enzyme
MKNIPTLKTAALAALTMAGGAVSASAITIQTVTVGNIGNAADTVMPNPGYGAVGYEYQIGKYEVTNAEYAAFLNSQAKTDTFSLYNPNMAGDGITRGGSSGTYTYAVTADFENKPVNYVSFWDATRFANWLNNGQLSSASTETGSYTLGSVTNPVNSTVTRTGSANWVVANENEWYKAAYYDPTKNSGAGGYWLYPTKSDSVTKFDANYIDADVRGSSDVGAYGSYASYYDTFDQGGNVFEWNDVITGASRRLRGGSWGNAEEFMRSLELLDFDSETEDPYVGFRVASLVPIPEPSTYGAAMGVVALGVVMMRRRKARGGMRAAAG